MGKARVFLTGGRGMVGHNILEHGDAKEWDFLAPSSRDLDLTDADATLSYLKDERPDIVIHAAGRVGGIQDNIAHPVDFLVTNTDLGRNVILGAQQAGVRKLINLGSSCIYPREATNPLHEERIGTGALEPTNEGYALAKIFALRLCQYIHREDKDFHYKTLIPCNLYGRYDKFAPEQSHLVPAIIDKIHRAKESGTRSVEIWGDGTARREFMYAGDCADAVFKALNDFETLPDLMNIGVGHDHTIDEYYGMAAEIIGWRGTFTHLTDKPVGMKQKLVATDRQKKWGWAARTTLREGLLKTYAYYKEKVAS